VSDSNILVTITNRQSVSTNQATLRPSRAGRDHYCPSRPRFSLSAELLPRLQIMGSSQPYSLIQDHRTQFLRSSSTRIGPASQRVKVDLTQIFGSPEVSRQFSNSVVVYFISGDKELLVCELHKQGLEGNPPRTGSPSTQITTHYEICYAELALGVTF
jgi:hypothetical protein